MTTSLYRGSAKIYQFPAGARPALGGHREETRFSGNVSALNPTPARVAKVVSGSAWYHEEAIQEAERAGKA